jgi:fructuronate reductase
MDSSQKLPQRLLGTVRDRLRSGLPVEAHALAVAAFMRHAMGRADDGAALAISDPLAARFAAIEGGDPAGIVGRFLDIEAVFGADLKGDPAFRTALERAMAHLLRHGAAAALHSHLAKAA